MRQAQLYRVLFMLALVALAVYAAGVRRPVGSI